MIRKTLTILSLIGLLLSVGLWGVSCFNCRCDIYQNRRLLVVGLNAGCFNITSALNYPLRGNVSVSCGGFRGFSTNWSGRIGITRYFRIYHVFDPWLWMLSIPLWMPTIAFGSVFCFCRPLLYHRRRKRKKLGLCVKCGYDLRASKERCPECGDEFGS